MVIIALYITLIVGTIYQMIASGKKIKDQGKSNEIIFLMALKGIVLVALIVLLIGQLKG